MLKHPVGKADKGVVLLFPALPFDPAPRQGRLGIGVVRQGL